MSTSRRDFIRASLLTSAVFGAESALTAGSTREAGVNRGTAKNVIFMVSDGMNHGALSLANVYRSVIDGKTTNWADLYRQRPVVRGLVETFSANSIVTDSAAAASAWGGGKRVNNGTLNMLPDGGLVETLHQKLQKRGRRTGLVSTATITHATPAGFAVNVDSRGKEELIAAQYLERQVDLLLGGGQKFFSPALRSHYQSAGYEIAESREVLLKLKPAADKKLLGLFSESHLPYSIDRSHDTALAEEVPTLAEMTQVALDWFGKTSEGFFLMVEGARIDHAGHQNDAATSIQDQLAFDDAIGTALGYLDGHPDTLLIITTDHGCGGIQMNGVNRSAKQGMAPGIYAGSTDAFRKLSGFRHSFEWMKQNGIDGLNGPKFAEALLQHTGIPLTADQLKTAQGLKLSTAEAFQAHHGIGWTGGNHTGDLVEFCAHGPGSDQFLPFMENHQIHALVLQALGLS